MTVLVTGGAGFIGSNLVRCLLGSGQSVRVLDDLSSGRKENLLDIEGRFEMVIGDVRDRSTVAAAVRDVDAVFHLAALPSVARSVADPIGTHLINAGGTLNVLLAARDQGVRRVVYASSSSVYGDAPILPKHEGMSPETMSPYAASKLAGEAYCRAFTESFGLMTVSLRFFNVFGPRQDPASEYAAVIPRFITQILGGSRPTVFGDGGQSRDFVYIANVVQACILAAEAGPASAGEAMNIGVGRGTSLIQLIEVLRRLLGIEIEPEFAPGRPGDVRDSLADIAKAEQLIGYRPLVDLREGLAQTVRWLDSRRDRDRMLAPSMSAAGTSLDDEMPARILRR